MMVKDADYGFEQLFEASSKISLERDGGSQGSYTREEEQVNSF